MKLGVIVAMLLVGVSSAWARDPVPQANADFSRLGQSLKAGDEVVVGILGGKTVKGRVVDISDAQIALLVDGVRTGIPADQITRVQRRRNGVLLGALIGGGVGVGFGLFGSAYANNEGGNQASALFIPIAVGLGAGIAIDAALVRPRTVFERTPSTQTRLFLSVGPKGAVARIVVSY
jgi:hypothetical protein